MIERDYEAELAELTFRRNVALRAVDEIDAELTKLGLHRLTESFK